MTFGQEIEREIHKIDEELLYLIGWYKRWRFHNTFLLAVSLVIFFLLLRSNLLEVFISQAGKLGFIGAALAGLFFVSTFTVAPAGLLLFYFAQNLNPVLVAIFASVGAIAGDHIIYFAIRDGLVDELRPIFMKLGGSRLTRTISTPYFAWLAPVIGAFLIITPFPNEIGIGLMGISRMKVWQFSVLSSVLNTIGIFAIVLIAASL